MILRPACVYGPGGEQWVGRICRWLYSGRIGLLGELGEGNCNLTYNEDLACAVVAALTSTEVNGHAFNIADPEPRTWNQYFLRLGHEFRRAGAEPLAFTHEPGDMLLARHFR